MDISIAVGITAGTQPPDHLLLVSGWIWRAHWQVQIVAAAAAFTRCSLEFNPIMETRCRPRLRAFLNHGAAVPLVTLRPPLPPLRQRRIYTWLHMTSMNVGARMATAQPPDLLLIASGWIRPPPVRARCNLIPRTSETKLRRLPRKTVCCTLGSGRQLLILGLQLSTRNRDMFQRHKRHRHAFWRFQKNRIRHCLAGLKT